MGTDHQARVEPAPGIDMKCGLAGIAGKQIISTGNGAKMGQKIMPVPDPAGIGEFKGHGLFG